MLHVAAIQLRTSASRANTLARAASLVGEAAARGARLCVLPESFTGPYGAAHFRGHAEPWKGKGTGTQLLSVLAERHKIYVCGGVIEQHPIRKDVLHNTIAAFGPAGQEVARYRKIHLSRVAVGGDGGDVTSEGDVLRAGEDLAFFDIHDEGGAEGADEADGADGRGWRVGLANCFDLRFREVSDMLAATPPRGLGAELLVYPSAWLKSTGDMGHWETLLKARALDGQCFTMGINTASDPTQDTVAFGRSCVVGPLGETLAVCDDDAADEVVSAKLTLARLADARKRIPLQDCRRPLVYKDALKAAQANPLAMMRPPLGFREMEAGSNAAAAAVASRRAFSTTTTASAAPDTPATTQQQQQQQQQQRITLTNEQVDSFRRDGFLRVPSFFTQKECAMLKATIAADASIENKTMPMADADGRESKLTLWFSLEDDTYSAFARSRSLVDAARTLIGDVEPYMFHTKIMLKEPRKGGAWEWHQDFGYWYAQGLTQPDRCFSCVMAIDRHTRANGCLQVLKGSHRLGRVEHGIFGDQAGADPKRVAIAKELFELVHCELNAGDMLFTHSNLLHASAPNDSDDWRRSMIVAYNGKDNGPMSEDDIIPPYSHIPVLEDGDLVGFGVVPHAKNRGDFLDAEANKDSFDNAGTTLFDSDEDTTCGLDSVIRVK
jgi:predicted amidohydrolase